MTERSRIALEGETAKAVTIPEKMSCHAGGFLLFDIGQLRVEFI
jgi:hypothetical protein